MLGFAILMFGMEMMSGAVEPLAESEEFQKVLLMFANPVLGMLVGCGFTILIQSSSAAVGILQALSATGAVTNLSAIPLIMGANVGSTTTALISSIGASRNAKRILTLLRPLPLCCCFIALMPFSILHLPVSRQPQWELQ